MNRVKWVPTTPSKLVPGPSRFVPVVLVVFVVDVVAELLLRALPPQSYVVGALADGVLVAVLATPILWVIVARQMARSAAVERLRVDARVTTVLSASSDGVVMTDRSGVVSYFNAGAEKIFGYTAGEVIGQDIQMLIPDDMRAPHAGHVGRFGDGPDSSRPMGAINTIEGRRKNGQRFPADVSISKLDTEGGVALMAVVRDITERRQAEEAVRVAESRLQTVVNSAPITIWAADTAGVFTLSDGLALGRAGLKPGENVSASALELFGAMPFTTHDGTTATGRELLSRALAGESIVAVNELGGAVFENHIVPQLGPDGAIVGAVGVATDITDRVKAQAALQCSEERFRAIFNRAPVGIAMSDSLTRRLLAVNPQFARIVGRTVDELAHLDWASITHPDDVRSNLHNVALLNAGTISTFQMEKRYLRPDGTTIWVKLTVAPIPTDGDAPPYDFAIVEDITERKRTEEVLRQSLVRLQSLSSRLLDIQETERRQLAMDLHDEIGQELTAIKINLQSLQRYPDPTAVEPRLADSVRIVERALRQVRSLSLSLRPPLLDDLGLAAALRWLVDECARRMGTRVEFRDGVSESRFDVATEIACFRIVQEALNNVNKHSGARNTAVDLHVQDGDLHLRVLDDGAGFDVAGALRRAAGGASLGLLGMEERARLAGGGIEWHSVPDRGTEVHAWFPLRMTSDTGRDGVALA